MIEALVGNLVGDYLLQNDWMALNKKKSTYVCAIHCFIWTVCVMVFAQWPVWTFLPLFTTHFIQDGTSIVYHYMSLMGQSGFRDGICSPWSIIIVDNVLHILTIFIVWKVIQCP